MTDDWSTPTGERMPFEVGNDDATPDSDLLLAVEERDLRLLDAFFHELALDASNDPTPNTPEEQAERHEGRRPAPRDGREDGRQPRR